MTLPVHVHKGLCWGENAQVLGKEKFPYSEAALRSVQLWHRLTPARVVLTIVHTGDSYPASSGGAAGNIGFGGKPCGRPEPTNIPAMTAAEAGAYCCGELAGSCEQPDLDVQ